MERCSSPPSYGMASVTRPPHILHPPRMKPRDPLTTRAQKEKRGLKAEPWSQDRHLLTPTEMDYGATFSCLEAKRPNSFSDIHRQTESFVRGKKGVWWGDGEEPCCP